MVLYFLLSKSFHLDYVQDIPPALTATWKTDHDVREIDALNPEY